MNKVPQLLSFPRKGKGSVLCRWRAEGEARRNCALACALSTLVGEEHSKMP